MTADWLSQQEWEERMEDASYRPTFTREQRISMAKAMELLDETDRHIIQLSYGGYTQEQIATTLGCSHQYVDQALNIAVRRLQAITKMVLVDWDAIPELAEPVKNRYLHMTNLELMKIWIYSRCIAQVADVLGVHKLTAGKMIHRLQEILSPLGLSCHVDTTVRMARHR